MITLHKFKNNITNVLTSIMLNKSFIDRFINIPRGNTSCKSDRTRLAELQEKCVVDASENFFIIFNDKSSPDYSTKIDLAYGDFKDSNDIFYDLKVSYRDATCVIQQNSLYTFGVNPNHWYICTDKDFSRVYIINAHILRDELFIKNTIKWRKSKYPNGENYIDECDYKNSKAVFLYGKKEGDEIKWQQKFGDQ